MTVISPGTTPSGKAPVRIKRPGERRSISRSATRALDVLECFGQVRQPLRAIDIGRLLDLHPSTTNQLLKTMIGSGHLVFTASGKTYLPSPRLAGFGGWIVACYGADEPLRRTIRELQRRIGMIVTLSAANDLFMQVVDWSAPGGQRAERGLQISLFGSVIGSAYLSTLEQSPLIRLARRARVPMHEIPTLLEDVSTIRRDGFADGPSGDAMWSLAAPLPRHDGEIQLIVGVAGPVRRVLQNRDALKRAMFAALRPEVRT
ncbi:MAG TPA: helix-turn-helix domain-containing protein [Steroidobacteraceae bacterium]|jgi:DNA-binding IclR family transcriptional regulator|nr:helix-turn-helix domain-containing protein [Steroidobacteraceae bacterium]